jgi:spore germination cell wall hydrolase CwlJ-like protein
MLIEEIVGPPISEDWKKSMKDAASIAAFVGGVGLAGTSAAQEMGSKPASAPTQQASYAIDLPHAKPYEAPEPEGPSEEEVAAQREHERELRLLAQTIWGEARNHGERGMRAVGHVIQNRAAHDNSRRYGEGIKGVVTKRKAFSCWNERDPNRKAIRNISSLPEGTPDHKAWLAAKRIAKEILSGESRDPTGGALYYHTTAVNPVWARNMEPIRTVANHIFYGGEEIAAARRSAGRIMNPRG